MFNSIPTDAIEDLRQLMTESGPNKYDMAVVAITACISSGIDTSKNIVAIAERLGLNAAYVRIILAGGKGTDPARHRWCRDEGGHYRLLA